MIIDWIANYHSVMDLQTEDPNCRIDLLKKEEYGKVLCKIIE